MARLTENIRIKAELLPSLHQLNANGDISSICNGLGLEVARESDAHNLDVSDRKYAAASDRIAAVYFLHAKQWRAAESRLMHLTQANPDDSLAHTWLAKAYKQMNDWQRAVQEVVLSRNWKCVYILGQEAVRAEVWDQARFIYETAIANGGRFGWAYYGLGQVYEADGNLEDGAAAYRDGIDADPKFLYNYTNLASLYAVEGKLDLASHWYAKALERVQEESAFLPHLGLGMVALQAGEAEVALEELMAARSLAPRESKVAYEISATYASMEQPGQAIMWLQEAVRLDPGKLYYRYDLASTYAWAGDCVQAGETWKSIAQLFDPQDSRPAQRYLQAMETGADCRVLVPQPGVVPN
ncbi:MAG: hypothetical protein M1358_02710 [Chloroflexi bacterium]|nr:hypothetical protein [Chloroflexota bacterium]